MDIVYHAAGRGDHAHRHPLPTRQIVRLGNALRAADRDLDRSRVGSGDRRPAFGLDSFGPLTVPIVLVGLAMLSATCAVGGGLTEVRVVVKTQSGPARVAGPR